MEINEEHRNLSTSYVMENVLENFGLKASGHPVKDYLQYYTAWSKAKDKTEEFRTTHDLDCVLKEGNLFADTIFSLWVPFKMYLQTAFPDRFSGGVRGTPRKNEKELDVLINDLPELLNSEVGHKLCCFAALAQTDANVMLIPNRRMQSRGMYWCDQMPIMLKECFTGSFQKYFTGISVNEWIDKEFLQAFFDGKPSEKSIKSLGPITSADAHWCQTVEEVNEMLDAYIDILRQRQEQMRTYDF